ncbi:hypothetical protein JHV675_52160 [Mycobacterium avium subsp. hominissuis]
MHQRGLDHRRQADARLQQPHQLIDVGPQRVIATRVDAAELAGWPEPTGVAANNDIDALLSLGADACCYNPLWPNVDELVHTLTPDSSSRTSSSTLGHNGL